MSFSNVLLRAALVAIGLSALACGGRNGHLAVVHPEIVKVPLGNIEMVITFGIHNRVPGDDYSKPRWGNQNEPTPEGRGNYLVSLGFVYGGQTFTVPDSADRKSVV